MKMNEIINVLKIEELTNCGSSFDISNICASDLMSEVLRIADKNCLMITNLINVQTIRTAEMVESLGILFVRGMRPNSNMITLANEKNISLFVTNNTLFEACGEIYKLMRNE